MVTTQRETRPPSPVRSARSVLGFLAGFAVLCGVLLGTSAVDPTGRWGLAILAAVLTTAVIVERIRCRSSVAAALRRLGLGRPGGRALAVAVGVSGLVLLVFPVTAAVSGTAVALRPDWPWLLIGVFAFHGLAEELVWRGYAFRRLREGRSFWGAAWWTMPLIAVTHVPIIATMGPAVGIGALAVAAVTSLPLAYLYETGRRTIWAPAVVHAAIDSFKLVVIPAAAVQTFSMLLIVAALTIPLLAFAVPRGILTGATDTRSQRCADLVGVRAFRRRGVLPLHLITRDAARVVVTWSRRGCPARAGAGATSGNRVIGAVARATVPACPPPSTSSPSCSPASCSSRSPARACCSSSGARSRTAAAPRWPASPATPPASS